ncbi:hypothetical protein LWI29_008154 [Acer saccharum]|uniref:Uncharacterized protein n=1 Tax=Acer saccharum TaxID=4024 RepID=A0AA39S324_ACESA|nr:hypothetical protein LWI29_008154 [Acer saccharum]
MPTYVRFLKQLLSNKRNLIASCISNCLVMLRLRIAFLHWAPPKALYRSAVRTAPIERCSDLIDLIGRCWVAVEALYVARYRALYVQRHSVSS